jgi:hypothetical protein
MRPETVVYCVHKVLSSDTKRVSSYYFDTFRTRIWKKVGENPSSVNSKWRYQCRSQIM